MKRTTTVLLSLTLLAAATVLVWAALREKPTPPTPETLIGKSADEVRALLGEPNAIGTGSGSDPAGSYTWGYQQPHVNSDKGGPIYLHFDKDNRVRKVVSMRP